MNVEIFIDANYVGSIVDRRSTSGYCSLLGGNLITWHNKKQYVVSRSSVKLELRAMVQGVCKALWIKRTLDDLRIQYRFLYKSLL